MYDDRHHPDSHLAAAPAATVPVPTPAPATADDRRPTMRAALALAAGILASVATGAAGPPVAVSPGSETGSLIESRCPTFTWGEAPGAETYEVIVYRLGETLEEAEPVLEEAIVGSASGWTPSLDRCLEPGGRYAWWVRSLAEDAAGEWSAPKLFEVVSRPSRADFEAAVEVVRRYLAEEDARGGQTEGQTRGQMVAASRDAADDRARAEQPRRVASAGGSAGTLTVSGGVTAASFAGNGAALTNLNPANLGAGTAGISVTGSAGGLTCSLCVDQTDVATNAITGAKIAPASIDAARIVDGAVTNFKLANGVVTSDKIANNAVGSAAIGTDAVGIDEIANNAVGFNELGFGVLGDKHFNINNNYPLKPTAWCDVTEVNSNDSTASQCPAGMAIIAISQESVCGDDDRCITGFTCARPCDLLKQYP